MDQEQGIGYSPMDLEQEDEEKRGKNLSEAWFFTVNRVQAP